MDFWFKLILIHFCNELQDFNFTLLLQSIWHCRKYVILRLKTNTRKFSSTMLIYSLSINFGWRVSPVLAELNVTALIHFLLQLDELSLLC